MQWLQRMKHKLLITLLVLFSVLMASCQESGKVNQFDVLPGGKNVSRIDLKKESAKQLSYEVQLPYPNTSVLDFYSDKLVSDDWKKCKPLGEWTELLKKEGAQYRGIRQLVDYAIHEETNKLLMISLRYFADPVEQLTPTLDWQNDKQYVTLIVYDLENLNQVLNSLSLNCSD